MKKTRINFMVTIGHRSYTTANSTRHWLLSWNHAKWIWRSHFIVT